MGKQKATKADFRDIRDGLAYALKKHPFDGYATVISLTREQAEIALAALRLAAAIKDPSHDE